MYSEPALISLQSMGNNSYQIIELLLFYNDFGWCPIIEHGDYVTPYPYWDSNKEDPDFKA